MLDAVEFPNGSVFTDWRFYRPNWLVRSDNGCWPCCQDLALPTTSDGTWSITYTYGQAPPEGAKSAARTLTTELVKACVADKSCRIPTGAVSVTKRGIIYDISEFEGRIGIPEIDMWLRAVNPKRRRQRARILSPDDKRFLPVVGS